MSTAEGSSSSSSAAAGVAAGAGGLECDLVNEPLRLYCLRSRKSAAVPRPGGSEGRGGRRSVHPEPVEGSDAPPGCVAFAFAITPN